MADGLEVSLSGQSVRIGGHATRGIAEARYPLDRTRVLESRLQDWLSLSGVRKSLPTNVPEAPGLVNVNALKFERQQVFALARQQDGGLDYKPATCVGNWVEDRMDSEYRSGSHPKELKTGHLYQTDYTDNFRPSSVQYIDRVKSLYGTAKFPRITGTKRAHSASAGGQSAEVLSGTHVYYSRAGFGSAPCQDHTPEARRGAFWVGTAPHKQFESVAMSAGLQQPLEFQGRCSTQDGESMLLLKTKPLTHTDASTLKATADLLRSQQWTKGWKTTHKSDFVRHSLR